MSQTSSAVRGRSRRARQGVEGVHRGLVALPPGPERAGPAGRLDEEGHGREVVGGVLQGAHEVGRAPSIEPGRPGRGRRDPRPRWRRRRRPARVGAAHDRRGPAVHHPLVGEQVAHGPAGAGRHARRVPASRALAVEVAAAEVSDREVVARPWAARVMTRSAPAPEGASGELPGPLAQAEPEAVDDAARRRPRRRPSAAPRAT